MGNLNQFDIYRLKYSFVSVWRAAAFGLAEIERCENMAGANLDCKVDHASCFK